MTRYVVTNYWRNDNPTGEIEDDDYRDAKYMRDEFGLHMFTVAEVLKLWNEYSASMAAGWMLPDKESIEQVFNVKLMEVED